MATRFGDSTAGAVISDNAPRGVRAALSEDAWIVMQELQRVYRHGVVEVFETASLEKALGWHGSRIASALEELRAAGLLASAGSVR